MTKTHFSQQDVLVAKICAVSDGLVVSIAKIKRQPCVVIVSRLITVLFQKLWGIDSVACDALFDSRVSSFQQVAYLKN